MQFMLGMMGDEARWEQMSPEEMQAFDKSINAYNDELRKTGAFVSGAGLQDETRPRRCVSATAVSPP
jgi:hypothetical protein